MTRMAQVRTTRAARVAGLLSLAAAAAAAAPSSAQPVPATNDVAACTLLADPTAQRSCIESAQQKRAATSFDPSAMHLRGPRADPQDGDGTGPRRRSGAGDRRRAPRRTGDVAPAADRPVQMP